MSSGQMLSLMMELLRGRVQVPPMSPGPGLSQELTESSGIKEEPEEQRIQKEEQLQGSVPEFSVVAVKTEEPSVPQQSERREETPGEDISSETEGHTEHWSDSDNDDGFKPFPCSAAFPKHEMASETSAHIDEENLSGAERAEHQSRFCGVSFETNENLQKPLIIHSGERPPEYSIRKKSSVDLSGNTPYSCTACNKTFSQKCNLDSHLRTHTGEKPYMCPICEKTFSQKGSLDSHIRTHTGEKPYSCTICRKTFTQKGNLESHMRTHTGEKPYGCSFCQKTFTQKASLDTHVRLHTGEKPYSCSVCEKTFTYKIDQDKHMRTHTGEKPLSCTICQKTFGEMGSLRRHIKTHSGIKPYSCPVCLKTFTRKGYLKFHANTHR